MGVFALPGKSVIEGNANTPIVDRNCSTSENQSYPKFPADPLEFLRRPEEVTRLNVRPLRQRCRCLRHPLDPRLPAEE